MKYYSATKRNKVLIHTTSRMNLKNIMLSERSQTQNAKYCMIPFTEKSRIDKSIETESRLVVAKSRERMANNANRYEDSEHFLKFG